MNSLIGDSRVRGLRSGKLSNLISDIWCVPGAKLSSLENNIRDTVILHHGEDEYDGKLHIYISAGICDLTKRLKSQNYQEVIFETLKRDSAITRVKGLLNEMNTLTLNQNAVPVFCTVYPMSLRDWNTSRLRHKKTNKLNHENEYPNMQRSLEETIEIINNFIYSLNKQNKISTPDINKTLKHNRGKGNHSYKYNLLKDGCHPNDLMKIKIKECLVQAMDKNRTGIKHL